MRKTFYISNHIKDRLRSYQLHHGMVDEQIAILRILDEGLKVEEAKMIAGKKIPEVKDANTSSPSPMTHNFWVTDFWPWQRAWGNYYK